MSNIPTEDELELNKLRRQAMSRRRAFEKSPLTLFVREMRAVMDEYRIAREQGMSREDAVKGIEAALRECSPFRLSKFKAECNACDDIGWRLMECSYALRCRRERCSTMEDSYTHTYVVPCDCSKGDKYRHSGERRERSAEDELATVGRGKKPRGFSRL